MSCTTLEFKDNILVQQSGRKQKISQEKYLVIIKIWIFGKHKFRQHKFHCTEYYTITDNYTHVKILSQKVKVLWKHDKTQ